MINKKQFVKVSSGGGGINYYKLKNADLIKEYQKENPDFIIPLIYDCIGRNILKNNIKLLTLVINNVMDTKFKEEDITIKDGRIKKEIKKERQGECDVLVEIDRHVINIEINKRKTNTMNNKNMSYIGDMFKNFSDFELCQININDFDIFKKGKEIYISKIKEENTGLDRIENMKIYDVSIGNFKNKCYTTSRRYEKDFIILMEIFKESSRKKIESKIKESILLKEVYKMQDKLNREDFVLERFPDDLFNEMEKKELKEEGKKEGIQEGIK